MVLEGLLDLKAFDFDILLLFFSTEVVLEKCQPQSRICFAPNLTSSYTLHDYKTRTRYPLMILVSPWINLHKYRRSL